MVLDSDLVAGVRFILTHGNKVFKRACLKLGMYKQYNIGLQEELIVPAITLVFCKNKSSKITFIKPNIIQELKCD